MGYASYPVVLREAGADDADMIIAVTDSDETNMLACKIADMLFKTPTKIARIRATEYLREDKLFGADALPVDMHISPERSEEHTSELQSLMRISYAVFCLKKKQKTLSTMKN